jgi:hypothetical protein
LNGAALDLLVEAQRHGVQLVATPAGTIRASAAKPPPPDLLAKLKAHRGELIAALAEAKTEEFEERAAIVEHDSNIPRAWAEGFAQLDPDFPPAGVPLKRWRRFVDDVGLFLDHWAAKAAALGWGPADLFGAHTTRPVARVDCMGLLWLVNGARVVALTGNTAIIETSGDRQSYRRKSQIEGRVMAWELAR